MLLFSCFNPRPVYGNLHNAMFKNFFLVPNNAIRGGLDQKVPVCGVHCPAFEVRNIQQVKLHCCGREIELIQTTEVNPNAN